MTLKSSGSLERWLLESMHEDMIDHHDKWTRQPYRKIDGVLVKVLRFKAYGAHLTGDVVYTCPETGEERGCYFGVTTEPSALELLAQCAD